MLSISRPAVLIVVAATMVLGLAIGTRLTFGLFLQPMTLAHGWGRETFALAIALQNLLWGVTQPFFGMLADRYGSGRVVAAGAVGYGAGLYLMSQASSPLALHLSLGLLIGLSLSATSFAVVLGAVSRAVSERRRSMAMGMASAGGSVGQLLMLRVSHLLIGSAGWVDALGYMAVIMMLMLPLAVLVAGKPEQQPMVRQQSMGEAIGEACGHRGFWLLTAGFFVCGFHVTFIGLHLPAYIVDNDLAPGLGATALAMIGGFNVLGSWFWGVTGGRYSKKFNLSILYLLRSLVILVLISTPVSETSILLFSAGIGFLWLGTVPLTNALVGQIFGVQYISTLFGIVFFGHQIGAFLGVWLGGYIFDIAGSYDPVWYISVILGLAAALLHWPINEQPVPRLAAARETA
ncbi:MAG: MFS transporter [SAR324 cluster bacterium]|nr:MFS transporter [SAR324 cluster bacterium]